MFVFVSDRTELKRSDRKSQSDTETLQKVKFRLNWPSHFFLSYFWAAQEPDWDPATGGAVSPPVDWSPDHWAQFSSCREKKKMFYLLDS